MDPLQNLLLGGGGSSEDDTTSSEDETTIVAAVLKRHKKSSSRFRKAKRRMANQITRDMQLFDEIIKQESQDEERPVPALTVPHWLHDDARNLWEEVKKIDDAGFTKKFRVSRESFWYLYEKLYPTLRKRDTQLRKALPVDLRIAVAIYMLKSGCESSVAAEIFEIGRSTATLLLHKFCSAVNNKLWNEVIKYPCEREQKVACANRFWERWQFPDTIGALDSTHIPIMAPNNQHKEYKNNKNYHSVVVLALVDADYKFSYVNVGHPGGVDDTTIFNSSELQSLVTNEENMGDFHIIGDGAYPLLNGLMEPYISRPGMSVAEKNFNARIIRARAAAEDAFERLKGRWKILTKKSDFKVHNMTEIIRTCTILHNICEEHNDKYYDTWTTKLSDYHERFPTPDKIVLYTESFSAVEKRNRLKGLLLNGNVAL